MKKRFEDLRIWQKAHQLVLQVYKSDFSFPPNERYGIESQLKRAIVSVPANIAEGYKRQHDKEFLHFLHIAASSLEEARYYFLLIRDLGYLNEEKYNSIVSDIEKLDRMLDNLILHIKKTLGII